METKFIDEYVRKEDRDGLMGISEYNQEITFFDFGGVAVQRNYFDNDNVRVVSGGRYFNADFVGRGMLTCSIEGEHEMAPPSKVILRTLRELSYNHKKGILLLVPGSTGNIFNFGLAVERARNDNLRVKMIHVKDTQTENPVKRLGKNGSTGVVLLSKVAGAMSDQGKTLPDIYIKCNEIADQIYTVEINGSSQGKSDISTVCNKNMCKDTYLPNIRHISESVCMCTIEQVVNIVPENSSEGYQDGILNLKQQECIGILINNNGSLQKVSLFKFINALIDYFTTNNIIINRIFLTSFECSSDVAVTIMKIDQQEILKYLDYPCNAPGWKCVNQGQFNMSIEQPIKGRLTRRERLSPPIRGPKLTEKVANTLLYATQFACDALISCEKQLNIIDKERGKGDTGTKLKFVAEVLLKRMKQNKIITYCPFTFFESLSKTLEKAVGGTSGCIYSILFEAAASSFGQCSETAEITPLTWLTAFKTATSALKIYGNVKYPGGTMYDPLYTCVKVAESELDSGKNFIDAFSKAVESAEYAIIMTKKDHKYPDSGAHAVGIWMRALLEGVKLTYNP